MRVSVLTRCWLLMARMLVLLKFEDGCWWYSRCSW
jgi:hypothetical protein